MYEQKHAHGSPIKLNGECLNLCIQKCGSARKQKHRVKCKTVPPLHTIVHPQAQINRTQ